MAGSMYQTEDDSNVVSGRREARRSAPPVLFRLPNLRFDRAHVAETNPVPISQDTIPKETLDRHSRNANIASSPESVPSYSPVLTNQTASRPVAAEANVSAGATNFVSTPLERTQTSSATLPKESLWKRWSGRLIVVVLAIATIYLWSKLPADKAADDRMKSEGIAESDLQPSFDLPTSNMPLAQSAPPTTEPTVEAPANSTNDLSSNHGAIEESKNSNDQAFELSWDAKPPETTPSTEAPEVPALVDQSDASSRMATTTLNEQSSFLLGQSTGSEIGADSTPTSTSDNPLLENQAAKSENMAMPNGSASNEILESQFENMEVDQMLASRQQYKASLSGTSNQAFMPNAGQVGPSSGGSTAANTRPEIGAQDPNVRTMLSGNTYPPSNSEMPGLTIPGGTMMSQPIQPAAPTSRLISNVSPSNVAPPAAGYGSMGVAGTADSSMPRVQPNQAPKLPPYTPTFNGMDPSLNPYGNALPAPQYAPNNSQPFVQGNVNPQSMMIQQRQPQLVPVQPNPGQPVGQAPNMINTGYPMNIPQFNGYPQAQPPRTPQGFGEPVGWPN